MTSALIDLPVYQPSGRIGLRAWAVFALVGVPLFLVLGWVYANVLALSPATPLDVIVVLLFWLCLFSAAMSIADRSHSRSARFSQAAGFLLGLAAWWMQWIVTLKSHGLDAQALAFANAGPLGWLQVLRDFAAWMVATREASASALTVLWSIEALAMLSIPAVMAKSCARQPYSETCRAWARSAFKVELYAAGAASTMLPQLLQERGVDALHQMRPAVQFDVQPLALQWWTLTVEGARWPTIRRHGGSSSRSLRSRVRTTAASARSRSAW